MKYCLEPTYMAQSRKELGKLQLQDELLQQMCDDFLRQRGDVARVDIDALVRGVVVAFHLVNLTSQHLKS